MPAPRIRSHHAPSTPRHPITSSRYHPSSSPLLLPYGHRISAPYTCPITVVQLRPRCRAGARPSAPRGARKAGLPRRFDATNRHHFSARHLRPMAHPSWRTTGTASNERPQLSILPSHHVPPLRTHLPSNHCGVRLTVMPTSPHHSNITPTDHLAGVRPRCALRRTRRGAHHHGVLQAIPSTDLPSSQSLSATSASLRPHGRPRCRTSAPSCAPCGTPTVGHATSSTPAIDANDPRPRKTQLQNAGSCFPSHSYMALLSTSTPFLLR